MSPAFTSRSLLRLAWVGLAAACLFTAFVAAPAGQGRASRTSVLYLSPFVALAVVHLLVLRDRWFRGASKAPRAVQSFRKMFFTAFAVGAVLIGAGILSLILF